jgi:hypothetical protein
MVNRGWWRRSLVWSLILVVAGFFAWGGATPPAAAEASSDTVPVMMPPGIYTYDEIQKAGIDPQLSSDDTGLPVCEVDTSWKGLGPESEAVPAGGPTECVADVTKFLFGYGIGVPTTGYHHNGWRTSNDTYAGGKVEVEVRDTGVDHFQSIEEFVASRVLSVHGVGPSSLEWIEAGWAEHSDRTSNTPEVYTYETGSNSWAFAPQYPLAMGSFYAFRTRNCTISGDDRQCGEIFWAGQWQLLRNSNAADCRNPSGTAVCGNEEYTEIYSDQAADPHPDLSGASAGNRIDWRNTELRTNGAVWVQWTHASALHERAPYSACSVHAYYQFYVVKGAC